MQLLMDMDESQGNHRGHHLDPKTRADLKKLLQDLKKSHGHMNHKVKQDLQKLISDLRDSQGSHGGHNCGGSDNDDCDGNDDYTPVSYHPGNNCDTNGDCTTVNLTGEASITGDPHFNGQVSVDGKSQNIHFDAQGGAGTWVDLFSDSNLEIDGQLDSWGGNNNVTVVGQEDIHLGNHEDLKIDAKTDKVTLNGAELQDGTKYVDGYKITKSGKTVTIERDGQTTTITDKGNYLDTSFKFNNTGATNLGGMMGDAIEGHADPKASDYAVNPNGGHNNPASYGNNGDYPVRNVGYYGNSGGYDDAGYDNEQSSDWALQLLGSLVHMLPNSDPLKGMLTFLINRLQHDNQGHHHHYPHHHNDATTMV
jgi:hypothetical protein